MSHMFSPIRRNASLPAWITAVVLSIACAVAVLAGKSEHTRLANGVQLHVDAPFRSEARKSGPPQTGHLRSASPSGAIAVDTAPLDISRLGPTAFGDWDETR